MGLELPLVFCMKFLMEPKFVEVFKSSIGGFIKYYIHLYAIFCLLVCKIGFKFIMVFHHTVVESRCIKFTDNTFINLHNLYFHSLV